MSSAANTPAVSIVQPDRNNDIEMRIAAAAQVALEGKSIFTSNSDAQAYLVQLLATGNLSNTRQEFRVDLFRVVVPLLEQATFSPEIFASSGEAASQALALIASNNARTLARALRDAHQQLLTEE